jgi:hypothetical protein
MFLEACQRRFLLECAAPRHQAVLQTVFAALGDSADSPAAPTIHLGRVVGDGDGAGCLLESPGAPVRSIATAAELIYEVDKDLTIALQRARPDLLFLHAAVVALDGRALALCGPSGIGKSTTAFALLHHGFRYLSDELAPIDTVSGLVHPYAHALCLKSRPPAPYRLPAGVLDARETLHVPVAALPGSHAPQAMPLAAVAFLSRDSGANGAAVPLLSAAATCAHVMSCALNALAHRGEGVDAALAIARQVPAYTLDVGDLPAAVKAVTSILSH